MTNSPPSPLADREQRLALFQMWFSDTIPHSKALGTGHAVENINRLRGVLSSMY